MSGVDAELYYHYLTLARKQGKAVGEALGTITETGVRTAVAKLDAFDQAIRSQIGHLRSDEQAEDFDAEFVRGVAEGFGMSGASLGATLQVVATILGARAGNASAVDDNDALSSIRHAYRAFEQKVKTIRDTEFGVFSKPAVQCVRHAYDTGYRDGGGKVGPV